MSARVAGLLLAAGAGSRMGGPKALLAWRGGRLLDHGVATLTQGGCSPVLVVLGAGAADVLSEGLPGAVPIVAERWAAGMGASLAAGLAAAERLSATAVVVALADQPLIGPEAIRRLLEAHEGGAAVAVATYAGKRRNPVLIAREHWADLTATLTGDAGARPWMQAHPDLVQEIDCDGTGSPEDLDTPADLRRLGARSS